LSEDAGAWGWAPGVGGGTAALGGGGGLGGGRAGEGVAGAGGGGGGEWVVGGGGGGGGVDRGVRTRRAWVLSAKAPFGSLGARWPPGYVSG